MFLTTETEGRRRKSQANTHSKPLKKCSERFYIHEREKKMREKKEKEREKKERKKERDTL